jgi:hypothetical protein
MHSDPGVGLVEGKRTTYLDRVTPDPGRIEHMRHRPAFCLAPLGSATALIADAEGTQEDARSRAEYAAKPSTTTTSGALSRRTVTSN